jgi:RNA polymerase sigma-70 factor (family 1)
MKSDKVYLKSLLEKVIGADDEQSFGKLFKLLYDRLVRFSNYFISNRSIAEEVVSDVFIKLWNNRKTISTIHDIEAYLYIAVKNQSLNKISAQHTSHIHISDNSVPELSHFIEVFDPQKELEIKELQFNMNLAIDSLPPQCKAVFKLIKEDGFKYKEVAEILNISPRTVETQLVRALKRLDSTFESYIAKKTKKSRKIFPSGLSSMLLNLFL